MLIGYNYLPAAGISPLGPPKHPIDSLHPNSFSEWENKLKCQGQPPNDFQKAVERRVRAYGNGDQCWDPASTEYLPRMWITNKADRKHTRRAFLQDINDLVFNCFL
jgi:hypothetical protein